MINKNFYRKTNDKKILHKVGKQWKVVSVALLMAIGGAAVATHANANAASTNDQNATQTNSLADYLNTPASANQPRFATRPASAKSSVAPSSVSAGVHYYSGDNGSAASYFDKVSSDHAVASKYYNTVNSYVQSLNVEYNPQVSSFAAKSASANSAASNDSKLAKSYSATDKDGNTVNIVNSLANAHHVNPDVYKGMVEDNEIAYSGAVSSASDDVQANNDVASLVNRLEGTNLSAASLSASTADIVASSNLNGANAISASVSNYYGDTGKGAGTYVNIANKLSADVQTLLAEGDPAGYNANMGMLLSNGDINKASAQSAVSSAITTAVNSAKNSFASIASSADTNFTDLSNYADNYGQNDNLISDYNSVANDAIDENNDNESAEYFDAVSAGAAEKFAPVLASATTSLYSRYGSEFAGYNTRSAESTSASKSASALVQSAAYALDIANANDDIITTVSDDVDIASEALGNNGNSSEAVASVASAYLNDGVTKLEEHLGLKHSYTYNTYSETTSSASFADKNGKITNPNTYRKALVASVNKDNSSYAPIIASILNNDGTDFGINANVNEDTGADTDSTFNNEISGNTSDKKYTPTFTINNMNDMKTALTNAANALNDIDFTNDSDTTDLGDNVNGSTTLKKPGNLNIYQGFSNIVKDAISSSNSNSNEAQDILEAALNANTNTTMNDLNNQVTDIKNALNDAAGKAVMSNTTYNVVNNVTTTPHDAIAENDDYAIGKAALLSDSVDLDTLESEAPAISNVASAASSASVSSGYTGENSAENLANDLSVAASSANSAENSAEVASANYSSANDEGVTLASYFASSYTTDANNESDIASTESSGLNSFFKSRANDATFNTADDAYYNAEQAATNDYKLGVGNAKAVYNSLPHFLDVLKSARIHTTPNFNTNPDKVVGSVNKGDRLTVKGINVSRNNSWRGVTRYYVYDNTNKKSGFITAQPGFTKGAYLSATADHANVEVKTLKPVQIYDQINGKKAIATLPAGKVVENADVVYDNADEDAQGFTKVETPSDDFFTANTDYVEIVVPTANTNNNTQSNYEFNLQNPNQKMGPYYNDASQN